MKLFIWALVLNVMLAVCYCEETADDSKSDLLLLEVEVDPEHAKSKRQAEHARSIGTSTQHIYGSAPGHYVLRTQSKEAEAEQEADYLSILRQIESGALQQQSAAAAQARPAIQQYVIPRQPQPQYSANHAVAPEQKILHVQTGQVKRPVYAQNQYTIQPTYQTARVPLVLRPSQAVRPTPVQGIYTNQGFVGTSGGHALHEARVQAALSVADDKQLLGQSGAQPIYQYAPKPQPTPLGDSTFEKELAQLVAANQAQELKSKPQAQAVQYVQIPQKQTFSFAQTPKPKQYSIVRPDAQAPKYVAPVVAGRAKSPKLPQQYLIETSKPQAAQLRQVVLKPKQQQQQLQYIVSTEEPRYFDVQQYQERISPMKIVAAPQFNQEQYKQYAQKESQELPAYLQYYQAIKPQSDDTANDVKLNQYIPRFAIAKQLPSAPTPTQEQATYVPKYQTQPKADDPNNYVSYKAAKPQLTSQYSSEDDGLIQALLAQSLQKSQQGLGGFATSKAASSETRPQVSPSPLTGTSHSSIFVSKALTPKKKISHVPETEENNNEEDVQTVRLPPPKNNKVYTQEEFQALVAAGYSVTPVPVTDDDDTKPSFNLAPENYPGHSKYRGSYATATQKQATESYASVTQAPRTRKVQRRRPASQKYRLQAEDGQAESESQPKLAYALPLDTQETVSYGMRKQIKSRNRPNHDDSLDEEADS